MNPRIEISNNFKNKLSEVRSYNSDRKIVKLIE